MPLSRASRNDRRRRVMLDAIANDTDLAVETIRTRKRNRVSSSTADENAPVRSMYRDPGYSQAVRRTCQQRLVQLIPVRRGTVAFVLSLLWLGFALLLFGHYWFHVRPVGRDAHSLGSLPISQLLHLRSTHGIGHWLTGQLWLLTALASWMIFSLRRHKLDDYRARYRIWIVVALAALFSSFDSATQFLYLLGLSIDGWAKREIGYGGWPLVLASFASLIGVLAIRLCSELKSVPTSVASWIFGLLSWVSSALLGTGLLKVSLSKEYLDLVVGSLWLGGILLVFQSAAIYLRTTYIHAQKRFLQRSGCDVGPISWRLPSLKKSSQNPEEEEDESEDETTAHEVGKSTQSGWLSRWSRNKDSTSSDEEDESYNEAEPNENRTSRSTKSAGGIPREEPTPKKLFGVIPNRHLRNEQLEYEPIGEDDDQLIDEGLTKTSGWFGIGGNKPRESTSESTKKNESLHEKEVSSRQGKSWWNRKSSYGDEANPVGKTSSGDSDTSTTTQKRWFPPIPGLRKRTSSKPTVENVSATEESTKRSLFRGQVRRMKDRLTTRVRQSNDAQERKGWLSIFDGLRLKPPTNTSTDGSEADGPKPIKPQDLPSTKNYDETGWDPNNKMSKSERKRLRRQQDDRRAA